jgi:hypothetical protein
MTQRPSSAVARPRRARDQKCRSTICVQRRTLASLEGEAFNGSPHDASGRGRSRCVARRPHSGTSCAPLTRLQSGHGCPGGGAAPGRRRGGRRRPCVEWTADGCEAAVFTAAARHRFKLAAVDSGGSAKLAEAAAHYDLRVSCWRASSGPTGPSGARAWRARRPPWRMYFICRPGGWRPSRWRGRGRLRR